MSAVGLFDWLLQTSWQASVLVLLVLAAQWALRKKMNSRWRYALWLLVLARLASPFSTPSSVSVFNYATLDYGGDSMRQVQRGDGTASPAQEPVTKVTVQTDAAPPVVESQTAEAAMGGAPGISSRFAGWWETPRTWWRKIDFVVAGMAIWMAGVLLLGVRLVWQNIIFARRIRNAKTVSAPEIIQLFEACRRRFGLRGALPVLETEAVKSPALYGLLRPVLLLPGRVLAEFSQAELRHVFLHELAHVKRHDMALHWLGTILRLAHWFNPALWFAFRRMAADRELACDELALCYAAERSSRPYGETILKLLETCARPAPLPGLIGILEENTQITRRISTIARFDRRSRGSIPALLLMAGLGVVSLTDAQQQSPPPVAPVTNVPALAPAAPPEITTGAVDSPIARQRTLLQEEIALVEQQIKQVRAMVQNGRAASDADFRLKLDLLELKLKLESVDAQNVAFRRRYGSTPAQSFARQKALLQEEIGLIEQQIKQVQAQTQIGAAVADADFPLRRELLQLKQRLEVLGGSVPEWYRKLHERQREGVRKLI